MYLLWVDWLIVSRILVSQVPKEMFLLFEKSLLI